MKIITVDREFGSGGRELGKRLADALNIPCYDQEIIDEVAKLHGLDPIHVEHISETDVRIIYPLTIGHRFSMPQLASMGKVQILLTRQEVIKKFAVQGDCVVVGHCADIILKEMSPMNLFVYADQQSKLDRCMERTEGSESQRSILHKMQQIDRDRKAHRELLTDTKWGRKEAYHLCINTSGKEIKTIIPGLVEYIRCWYQEQ